MTSRRDFLKSGLAATLAAGCAGTRRTSPRTEVAAATMPQPGGVPKRALGRAGAYVSILGVGGYHLGDVKSEGDAIRIVHEALDRGVTFFDNAWEYHDGESEMRLGKALEGRRDKAFVMTKVCTHGRSAAVAMTMLEESLRRLRTDHLDLWQVHEVIYDNDPDLVFASDGVFRALERAKQQGKVRFVGFTGHKAPEIHMKMLSHGFAFDTVQMPLNCFDATFRSFEQIVLPEVNRRGMAAIGMKSLGGEGVPILKGAVTAEEALRYAMSLPVAVTVTGIDSLGILRQNLAIAVDFKPMTAEEMDALRKRVAPLAGDGRFELYKTTMHFDAKVGRAQHGMLPEEKLPF